MSKSFHCNIFFIEYSYIPKDVQISQSLIPLLSPYIIFKRHRYSLRYITSLITTRRSHMKEYVQSSRMDQCSLTTTFAEQYVNIEIPEQLVRSWQPQGYTRLHYGAIRLVLSLHGRRGLLVTARVSLLDSNYIHYENAMIRTKLTSLHVGSIVLTIFPNSNISLKDPTLPQRMKV